MEIQLAYSSTIPHTDIWINDHLCSDKTGPLSSVANYPLQSWLYRRGTWPGLAKVLRDLARERNINITFIGEESDYHDLVEAITELQHKTFCHKVLPPDQAVDSIFSNVKTIVFMMKGCPVESAKALVQYMSFSSDDMLHFIVHSPEDYWEKRDNIQKSRTLVTIDKIVFDEAVVKKDLYNLLREHFLRPSESILILAHSQGEKMALMEELTGWGAGLRPSVALENEREVVTKLTEKYSMPEKRSRRVGQLRLLPEKLESFIDDCRGIHDEMMVKKAALRQAINIKQEEVLAQEYEQLRKKFRWWENHQNEIIKLKDSIVVALCSVSEKGK